MSETLFSKMDPVDEPAGWHVAHCDGGSRGNPGPAGYGAVVEDPQGRVVARLSEYLGRQTNNFAEYSGLLAVLGWALEHGVKRLRVVSDSELMVNQMKGRYKVASPTLRPLWDEARRKAARLEGFEMRHTLRGGNQEADRLANEAMDKGMGRGSGSGPGGPAAKQTPAGAPGGERVAAAPKVVEGYVQGGVVHLLDGAIPDGTFVTVHLKR
ncbi:MAG: ribonuclease HI family protein [Terracidiphilus sp.]